MTSTSTPSQADAMAIEVDTKNVKVETVSSSEGMPTISKLAHVLGVVVAAVIAVAVAIVLADGTSVIKLKPVADLPVVTAKSLKSTGFDHRLDQLLGPTYGIGLHHDQAGHTWTEMNAGSTLKTLTAQLGLPVIAAALPSVISTDGLKHPVPFLKCDDLQMAGLAAMSLGGIAEAVAVVMVIFHALALTGMLPAKPTKVLAGLVWFVLTAGFLTVVLIALGVYQAEWTCDNEVVPKITLSEHFDYNYGFGFAVVGWVSSLLLLCVTLACTTTDHSAPTKAVGKTLGGVVAGLLIGGIAIMVTMLPLAYANPKPAAPDTNPCEGQKPYHAGPGDNYFKNVDCVKEGITQVLEQAGANVTKGYRGGLDAANRVPITSAYSETDLCPVNVHWHLGAEHLSVGQYDEAGHGPHHRRNLAGADIRQGFQCHHYNANDTKFTSDYTWQHCTNMEVGQTYEIHWPHSAAGACGTKYQYQTPFYDGVFCRDGIISIAPLNTYEKIGVQSQVFTVVNDEAFYNGDLIKGMIVDGDKGADIAKYTGSTTGTSRDNNICSRYTPITWQVDRKCHMISASSFDKLCADMKKIKTDGGDDMKDDLYPHGSRTLVATHLTANNQQSRK